MTNKIKILQIVPSLSQANGVAAYINNYFVHIDKNDIEMTFLVLNDRDHGRYKEIKDNGGTIIELYREKNIFKYISKVKKFFKYNKFDIVHCHVANIGLIYLYYSKKYGIKKRILHSHATVSSDKFFHKLRNDIVLPVAKSFANVNFACSEAAGKAMFKKQKFEVINNAIDTKKFKFSTKYRNELRKELKLNDKLVIGNIGRLCRQKNQTFLLKVIAKLKEKEKNVILLMVGNGELENQLKNEAKILGIEENVLFLGSRNDTYKIYNALDILVLPSLYEGLPVVGIEAQANGLECIFSNNITKEVKISSNVKFLDINIDDIESWVTEIISAKNNKRLEFQTNEYDIDKCAIKLKEKYIDLVKMG